MQAKITVSSMIPAAMMWSCSLLVILGNLSACSLLTTERVVYDQHDIRIGIEADPSIGRSGQAVVNNHPATLTPKEIESLLRVIQVSGWSGTLVGLLETPRPVPLFTPEELAAISSHLAAAFSRATPTERVFFSLPKPGVSYSEDRTVGSLFLRGRYLHVVVTDHSSLIQADTGGGDYKDIRDSKGMKLWVAAPAVAAMVPDLEEPQWASFETVHLSLNVKQVLAQQVKTPPARISQGDAGTPASSTVLLPKHSSTGVSTEDLQLQVQELTTSNLELRSRLAEQDRRMKQINDQLEQLRLELDKAKSQRQPLRKLPAQ